MADGLPSSSIWLSGAPLVRRAEAQLAGLKKSLRESRVACAALDAAAGARAENRQGAAVQTDWEPIAMPLPAPPKPAGRAP